uniref:Uncharacterized protein n=2 Tax=Ditylum brightwellii TaxID=49249 RepID=A0A7S4VK19_9STRA
MASSFAKQRTTEALKHLQSIKPTDGFITESYLTTDGTTLIRLKRRGISLSEKGYLEIVHDASSTGCVVGITSYGAGNVGRGVVLVEKNGAVCRDLRDIRVILRNPAASNVGNLRAMQQEREDNINRARNSQQTRGATEIISEEDNKQILQFFVLAVLGLIVLRALTSALLGLYILGLPLLYMYAISTAPSLESFDAKKELKRVLRGENLPEDHPDKPKDWLSQTLARVAASVTTEVAGLGGYEVTMTDYLGACKVASVNLLAANQVFYWVGVFGKWRFVTRRDVESDKND